MTQKGHLHEEIEHVGSRFDGFDESAGPGDAGGGTRDRTDTSESTSVSCARLNKQVKMAVKANIIHINSVDHKGQSFNAELVLRVMTTNVVSDNLQTSDGQAMTLKNWEPRIRFLNLAETISWKRKEKQVTRNPNFKPTMDTVTKGWEYRAGPLAPAGPGYYRVSPVKSFQGELEFKYTVSGKFTSQFKLSRFPFDTQELNFRLSSTLPVEALAIHRHEDRSVAQKAGFTECNVYEMHEKVDTHEGRTDPDDSTSGTMRPVLDFRVLIRRKSEYYYHNVYFPMLLIDCMALGSFAVDKEDTADRLSVTLTMVLSALIYKIVISEALPDLSYITVIDFFLILQLLFLALVGAQNMFAAQMTQEQDTLCMYTAVGIFAALVIRCIIGDLWYRSIQQRKAFRAWDDEATKDDREAQITWNTEPENGGY